MSYLGQWQTRQVFEVSKAELELQDLAMNMDEITELQDSSVFGLKPTIHITSWLEKDLIQGIII